MSLGNTLRSWSPPPRPFLFSPPLTMPWLTVLGATSAYGPDAPLPSPGPHVIDPNTAAGPGSGGLGLAVHREKVPLPVVTLALVLPAVAVWVLSFIHCWPFEGTCLFTSPPPPRPNSVHNTRA